MGLNCGDLGVWKKIKLRAGKGLIIKGFVRFPVVGIYYLSLGAVQSHWDSLSGELHSLMGTVKSVLFHILEKLYASLFIKVRKLLIAISVLIFTTSDSERKGEKENK